MITSVYCIIYVWDHLWWAEYEGYGIAVEQINPRCLGIIATLLWTQTGNSQKPK